MPTMWDTLAGFLAGIAAGVALGCLVAFLLGVIHSCSVLYVFGAVAWLSIVGALCIASRPPPVPEKLEDETVNV